MADWLDPLEPFTLLACGLTEYLAKHQGLSPQLRELFGNLDAGQFTGQLLRLHAGRAAANDLFAHVWDEICGLDAFRAGRGNPFRDGSLRFPARDEAAGPSPTEEVAWPSNNDTTSN